MGAEVVKGTVNTAPGGGSGEVAKGECPGSLDGGQPPADVLIGGGKEAAENHRS